MIAKRGDPTRRRSGKCPRPLGGAPQDLAMWRPNPSGPQGPMQVGEAAATDVGGGDRFDLTAGVAAYTVRVLYDSGLCYSTRTTQLRRSAIFDGDLGFRPAVADPFTHSIFACFDPDGGAFTGNQRYLCGAVPSSFSKAGLSRLKQGAAPSQSRFEEITASARQFWRTGVIKPTRPDVGSESRSRDGSRD
jgi:hypothetical protein